MTAVTVVTGSREAAERLKKSAPRWMAYAAGTRNGAIFEALGTEFELAGGRSADTVMDSWVSATSSGAGTLTKTGASWTVDEWIGYYYQAIDDVRYLILSNTTDTLTLDTTATPTEDSSTRTRRIVRRGSAFRNVYEGGNVRTAVGYDLDVTANNVGVRRPDGTRYINLGGSGFSGGVSDARFRAILPSLSYSRKMVRATVVKFLTALYGGTTGWSVFCIRNNEIIIELDPTPLNSGIGFYMIADESFTGTGTISSTGTAVTGSGTAFEDELAPGRVIIADGQKRTIASISSDTALVTEVAFSPALSAEAFTSTQAENVGDGSITPSTDPITSYITENATDTDLPDSPTIPIYMGSFDGYGNSILIQTMLERYIVALGVRVRVVIQGQG